MGAREIWLSDYNPYRTPFIEGVDGNGREVLVKFYELWMKRLRRRHPRWRKALRVLQGLRIGCPCKPPCHGSILAALVDNLPPESAFSLEAIKGFLRRNERLAQLSQQLREHTQNQIPPFK